MGGDAEGTHQNWKLIDSSINLGGKQGCLENMYCSKESVVLEVPSFALKKDYTKETVEGCETTGPGNNLKYTMNV